MLILGPEAVPRVADPVVAAVNPEEEGRTEGWCAGRARSVIAILEERGLDPTDAECATILGTTDDAMLERWLRRALKESSTARVLEVDASH